MEARRVYLKEFDTTATNYTEERYLANSRFYLAIWNRTLHIIDTVYS